MRIDVTYAGHAPRVIETGGESLVSSGTLSVGDGEGLPVTAVMLRPRLDLLGRDGHGLAVEICGWSTATYAGGAEGRLDDLGGSWEVPLLSFHVFRLWEVLPAGELDDVVAIDIDDRMHVARVGGDLVDLTAFEVLERELLSAAEVSAMPLHKRVWLVHDRARRASPGTTDEEVGARYGLGTRLIDWARGVEGTMGDAGVARGPLGRGDARAPEAPAQAAAVPVGSGVDDGLSDLVAELAAATGADELRRVVERAILDVGVSLTEAEKACARRGVGVPLLERVWREAEDELWG